MAKDKTIQLINGPNLNMLSKREPGIYGKMTLDEINESLKALSDQLSLGIHFFQSNHEGEIVDTIHQVFEKDIDGVIINPAAYTHTSVAIRDALLLLTCPIIEIHLSNIYKRESFRHKSMLTDIVTGQISGFGHYGYTMALNALNNILI